MSESFYLSIIGVGSALITALCLAGCTNLYRIKCMEYSCWGLDCTRDIDAENQADINNPTDVIPPSVGIVRRNSR
jgi:hypothetical protein